MRNRLSILLLVPAFLGAQAPDLPGWTLLEGAGLFQKDSDCVKSALGLGLGAGAWASPHWGWEATWMHGKLKDKAGTWSAGEDHLDASALLAPWGTQGRCVPFLRGGLGASQLQNPLSLTGGTVRKANLLVGAGAQVRFSTAGLGSLELRSVTVDTATRRQEFELVAGLGLRWGRKAVAAPVAASPAPPTPVTPAAPPAAPVQAPLPIPAPVEPPAAAPAPAPLPAPAPEPRKFVLGEAMLHFPNNGDALGKEAKGAIAEVAAKIMAYPGDYHLVVGGHTSSTGSAAHNKDLSRRRAEAVARELVAAGIPSGRIEVKGFGPDQPIADNRTKAGQSRNRRVEIEVRAPGAEVRRAETAVQD